MDYEAGGKFSRVVRVHQFLFCLCSQSNANFPSLTLVLVFCLVACQFALLSLSSLKDTDKRNGLSELHTTICKLL